MIQRRSTIIVICMAIVAGIVHSQSRKEHSLANSRTPIYMNQNNILLKRHSRKKREDFIFEEEDFNPNGGYGHWSEWSSCSRSCGAGERTRTRKCHDVTRCHDGDVELKFCFLRKCNVKTK
uniref:A disintegrin and metalloproteinase with thrombospondin motifs adt-2-like n=1 Tax=Crassostrea virginica TaxID=6565 RepID=A0A8B8EBT1_CRAVI|nr:A disintegrin and metalloproteinase with thrombospondin motifs adt-2-like [Crassostrea virginica]